MAIFWRIYLTVIVSVTLAVLGVYVIAFDGDNGLSSSAFLVFVISLLALTGGGLWFVIKHFITDRLRVLGTDIRRLSGQNIDLTKSLEVNGNDELSQLFDNYNQAVKDFDSLLIKIKSSAVRLKPMSIEFAETSMGLSQRNQLQLLQNSEVGSELDSLNQSAEQMKHEAEDIVNATVVGNEAINKGQAVVNSAYDGITRLASSIEQSMTDVDSLQQASVQIGEAIGVIQSIAEETNLLALNAAIEAARAGEYGRGFSVVADEVRNLSSKTQQSTKQVERMVLAIQKATDSVVTTMREGEAEANSNAQRMGDAKQNFNFVSENIQEISQCAENIAQSIHEQVQSLLKVTDINNEMNDLNNDILNFSRQSGLSESDLTKLSEHIFMHIANYRLSQSQFDTSQRGNSRHKEETQNNQPKVAASAPKQETAEIELF